MFTLAHLSDPHLGPLTKFSLRELIGKRATGYVNWRRKRRHVHDMEILGLIVADILAQKPDHIVCLEDGKKMKMLRRHLATDHGMTPEDYRAKWNLPKDYPMTAPAYAEKRRALAKEIGLGTKGRGGGRKKAPARRAK